MKKQFVPLIFGAFFILSISGVIAVNDNENNGVPSLLSELKEVLQNILEKVNLIAEKNETININVEPNISVESPIVNVEANDMAKRGNIVLKEYSLYGVGYPAKSTKTIYVALPNGNCSVILSSDCPDCELSVAKNINVVKNAVPCSNDCSASFDVNDEYYLVRIRVASVGYNEMYLAYNCI